MTEDDVMRGLGLDEPSRALAFSRAAKRIAEKWKANADLTGMAGHYKDGIHVIRSGPDDLSVGRTSVKGSRIRAGGGPGVTATDPAVTQTVDDIEDILVEELFHD